MGEIETDGGLSGGVDDGDPFAEGGRPPLAVDEQLTVRDGDRHRCC